MASFDGFPREFFEFFTELEANNDKDWFTANRKRYQIHVVATSRAFVDAMGARMRDFQPGVRFEAKANKSLGRINRDVRFSKDKRPYNLHMTYRFWEGEGKVSANPHYTMWVGPDGIGVGAGIRGIELERLDGFRDRLVSADAGGRFTALMEKLDDGEIQFIGEKWKRVPKGWPEDHANARWLKHAGMACYLKTTLPSTIHSAEIIETLADLAERMAPLHNWIMEWH